MVDGFAIFYMKIKPTAIIVMGKTRDGTWVDTGKRIPVEKIAGLDKQQLQQVLRPFNMEDVIGTVVSEFIKVIRPK